MTVTIHDAYDLARAGYHLTFNYAPTADGCSCGCTDPTCRNRGKHPRGGHTNSTKDTLELLARSKRISDCFNLGIALEASDLVDISSDSPQWQAEFERRGLPDGALVWDSPSGRHHAYRRPDGCPVTKINRAGQFDLMAIGMACAPPSVSGKGTYNWVSRIIPRDELPEAPAWAVAMLREAGATDEGPGRRDRPSTEWEGPPAALAPIVDGCAWLRHCRDDAATLGEPEWYAMLSIVARTEGGEVVAHEWSKPYPDYSAAATDAKIAHALTDAGPRRCSSIKNTLGASECEGCPSWGVVTSPINLAEPAGVLITHHRGDAPVDAETGEVLTGAAGPGYTGMYAPCAVDDDGSPRCDHADGFRAVIAAQQAEIEQLRAENTRLRTEAAARSVESMRDERITGLSAQVGDLRAELDAVWEIFTTPKIKADVPATAGAWRALHAHASKPPSKPEAAATAKRFRSQLEQDTGKSGPEVRNAMKNLIDLDLVSETIESMKNGHDRKVQELRTDYLPGLKLICNAVRRKSAGYVEHRGRKPKGQAKRNLISPCPTDATHPIDAVCREDKTVVKTDLVVTPRKMETAPPGEILFRHKWRERNTISPASASTFRLVPIGDARRLWEGLTAPDEVLADYAAAGGDG